MIGELFARKRPVSEHRSWQTTIRPLVSLSSAVDDARPAFDAADAGEAFAAMGDEGVYQGAAPGLPAAGWTTSPAGLSMTMMSDRPRKRSFNGIASALPASASVPAGGTSRLRTVLSAFDPQIEASTIVPPVQRGVAGACMQILEARAAHASDTHRLRESLSRRSPSSSAPASIASNRVAVSLSCRTSRSWKQTCPESSSHGKNRTAAVRCFATGTRFHARVR